MSRHQQPPFHAFVEQTQAMPRGDKLEWQRRQEVAILRLGIVEAHRLYATDRRLIKRKVVRAHKTEALEEFMAGRQVAKQVDHYLCRPEADRKELLAQTDPVQNLLHIRMITKPVEIKAITHGQAEEQISATDMFRL